jgi:hypothetical protein
MSTQIEFSARVAVGRGCLLAVVLAVPPARQTVAMRQPVAAATTRLEMVTVMAWLPSS